MLNKMDTEKSQNKMLKYIYDLLKERDGLLQDSEFKNLQR